MILVASDQRYLWGVVRNLDIKKAPPIGETFCVMLALPIFPASHPASIVGADELNFCVRDGNRWALIAINTNYVGWVGAHRLIC